jgi:phosphate transport system ATP-binding protein
VTTVQQPGVPQTIPAPSGPIVGPAPSSLAAANVSAWFGTHKVLERISLQMEPGKVTALIGPSGCGKSSFHQRRSPGRSSSMVWTSTGQPCG